MKTESAHIDSLHAFRIVTKRLSDHTIASCLPLYPDEGRLNLLRLSQHNIKSDANPPEPMEHRTQFQDDVTRFTFVQHPIEYSHPISREENK